MQGWADWADFYESTAAATPPTAATVYGVPYQVVTRGNLIYRKGLFERAGLDPAAPPRTWEEAQAAAQRLTQTAGAAGSPWPAGTSR